MDHSKTPQTVVIYQFMANGKVVLGILAASETKKEIFAYEQLRQPSTGLGRLRFVRRALGIILGVGRWPLRPDVPAPLMELRLQLLGSLRLLLGQVLRLSDIVLEVVELHVVVFKELDQLPVAGSYSTVRRSATGMVVGIVPVERFAFQWLLGIFEQWHEADAVNMFIVSCVAREAADFQECRIKITGNHGLVAYLANGCDTWPVDDQRNSYASLVRRPLARS